MRRPLIALAASALLALGCFATSGTSSNAIPLVKVHAENDLDCPQRDIRVVQEAYSNRFTAIGCGRKVTYLTGCDALRCVVEDQGRVIPWGDRPEPRRANP